MDPLSDDEIREVRALLERVRANRADSARIAIPRGASVLAEIGAMARRIVARHEAALRAKAHARGAGK